MEPGNELLLETKIKLTHLFSRHYTAVFFLYPTEMKDIIIQGK